VSRVQFQLRCRATGLVSLIRFVVVCCYGSDSRTVLVFIRAGEKHVIGSRSVRVDSSLLMCTFQIVSFINIFDHFWDRGSDPHWREPPTVVQRIHEASERATEVFLRVSATSLSPSRLGLFDHKHAFVFRLSVSVVRSFVA